MARERWPKARRSSGANQRALRCVSGLRFFDASRPSAILCAPGACSHNHSMAGQAPARWPPPNRPSPANQHASTAWGLSCLPAIVHTEQAENRFFAPERRYTGFETLARPFEFGTSFTDDVDRVGSWERDLTKRLVVDDGPAVQMTISLLLIRAGYSVRVASDGERGVAAFETAGFDRSSTSSCRVWTGSRPCD